jgi:polyisoprenoid-binding protein YceI
MIMRTCVAAIVFAIASIAGAPCASSEMARASTSQKQIGVLELDPARTTIEFTLPATMHTVHGTFRLARGTIKGDWESGEAEGAIVIDSASGNSGSDSRDEKMRDEVLEGSKYPEISFTPRQIAEQSRSGNEFSAKLEGILIIHGGEHPATIEVRGRIDGDNLTATGHLTIPYVEWGLKDPSFLFFKVANQVDIDVSTVGRVSWVATEIRN